MRVDVVAESKGAASVRSARAGLARLLRARRTEIEEAIVARFRDVGFDPAAGEDAEYVAGARAAVAEAVDYGLTAIEHGEEWFGSIPPAAVAQARRAARNSVSLERVLLRYNAGHTLLEDFVMQAAESSKNRVALRHVLRTLGALLDHFTASIAREYQQEVERVTRSPELRRAERVQRLLAGAPVDTAQLGYDFDVVHVGLIGMGARASETVRALAVRLSRELLSVSRTEQTVWAWFGGKRPFAVDEIERLMPAVQQAGVSLAVGEPAVGIDGWRLTHRQAQAAMLIALRRPQALTRYADVALLAAVLRDRELAQSLIDMHLSQLDSQKNAGNVSRETLRAYFAAGCNAATAAAALGVDRHTVQRRLHTIETQLGRLLHTCHAELEVALRLEELGDAGGNSIQAPTH
jgi:PucR C-terminal helix-turn-helix domain/GGDEF-like domain